MRKILTIFTPTYNRAKTLVRLYNSLLRQNNSNFVWLIIDDGSTDNTGELISKFKFENKIKIIYKYIQNSGKMNAHNIAVKMCETPLFMCLDSDDYLSNTAVKDILNKYEKIINDNKLVGLVAYRKIINPVFKLNKFPPKIRFSSLKDLYKKGLKGDTTLVFKTSTINNFLFPKVNGEKFMTEAFIYDQLDRKYKYLVLRKYLIICEYQDDGYTLNSKKLYLKNPTSWAMYYEQSARFSSNLKHVIKNYAKALAFNEIAKNKIKFYINIRIFLLPISCLFKNIFLKRIKNYDK